MFYEKIAEVYEKLETTSSKKEKTRILANLFRESPEDVLPKVVLLSQGLVYPKFLERELGVATQMLIKIIAKATGFKEKEVVEIFKETGDLGLTAEKCVEKRKQVVLFRKKLTVGYVFDTLRKLAEISGAGSQERKIKLLAGLLVSSSPKEARYITRTVLQELRIGVAEGIVRDAIAEAFLVREGMSKNEIEKVKKIVERAWCLFPDFGEIARIAKTEGVEGLKKVKVKVGFPIMVMLGEKAESIEEVLKDYPKVAAEYKYDGMRAQCHKKGDKIWIYTRRLENVTQQFPDLVELCKKCLLPKECIVEGEVLAINPEDGSPLPFQVLSQRIHRKYEIERMVKEIPIQMNLFDVVYVDGEMLFDKKFLERRKILEKIVKVIPGKFQLAKQIISSDLKELERFYKEALDNKQEGIFLKVLDSEYMFGRHVGGWYKIKPIMETLDLVVVGATWGEGKRAKWLSSYVLACRDPDTGNFLRCGMMGTGLTEEQFEEMTELLKPLIIKEEGKEVLLKPKVVVEVGYQEIQKSPKYESGFALRFPRLIRVRYDKGPEEADTLERVKNLFLSQGKAG